MKLLDADAIVRSKDAGPFRITLDVIFKDRAQFEQMRDAHVWTREHLASLYRISPEDISHCLVYEPANAFKCTFQRAVKYTKIAHISGAACFGNNELVP